MVTVSGPDACTICSGRGVIVRPSGGRRGISSLELCECVLSMCNSCEGVGEPPFIYLDEEAGLIRNCPCLRYRRRYDRIVELYRDSGIPEKFRYRFLNDFRTDSKDREESIELAKAHDNAYHLIEAMHKDKNARPKGLYLYGPAGTGKTMLGSLILNEIIFRFRKKVKSIKVNRDFFNPIRGTFNAESDLYGKGDEIFNSIAGADVLMIDDFGVQADSEWEKRMFYDLIDTRYENQKTTLITSNHDPAYFKEVFQGRVYSRLKEMTAWQPLITGDYRDHFS